MREGAREVISDPPLRGHKLKAHAHTELRVGEQEREGEGAKGVADHPRLTLKLLSAEAPLLTPHLKRPEQVLVGGVPRSEGGGGATRGAVRVVKLTHPLWRLKQHLSAL